MNSSLNSITIDTENNLSSAEPSRLGKQLADSLIEDLTVKPANKYTFHRSIGRGGMKLITEVHDKDTSRQIAVAELLDPSKKMQYARFVREAKITGNLEHPNIVPIHDIGISENGTPYFTMKLLKGETLASVLKKLKDGDPEYVEKWTLTRLLMVFRKICNGIGFAHTKNVVHLDLSPENVQLGEFGDVLVLDWGLAKIIGDQDDLDEDFTDEDIDKASYQDGMPLMTMDGDIKGTPGYMAPEQAAGRNTERDVRTDIYALGAILYSILTYEPPVRTQQVDKMLADTIEGRINPIRKNLVRHHIPSAMIAVTLKALRLDAGRRYQSVREMRKEIDAFISGFATEAEQANAFKESILFLKRHRVAATLGTIIFAMFIFVWSLFIEEKRLQTADWKLVFNENFRTANYDISRLAFTDELLRYQTDPWKVTDEGLYCQKNGWIWLNDISVLGDVKIEIKVKLTGSADLLWLSINSKRSNLARRWNKPSGYTFQFGGFNSTSNVLYKSNVVQGIDMAMESVDKVSQNIYHTIIMTRIGTEIVVSVDGIEKVNVTDMFPPTGRGFKEIGVKSMSGKIKIASLSISRLGLPEKASPLITGDVLVENLHFSEAVDKYITIAEDFGTGDVAEKALAKAYFTAATKLNGDQSKLLRKIKFKIELNFTKYKYNEEILEVDALKAWTEKKYNQAFIAVDKLLKLNADTAVVPKILQIAHTPLSEAVGQKLLNRIAQSKNIYHLDISNYGLSEISAIKGMPLSMLDCSRNNLRELYPLVNMQLKRLDCSYNSIKELESLKYVTVEELDCSNNNLTELFPLRNSLLTSLNILGNTVSDIEIINSIPTLEKVLLSIKTKNIESLKKSQSIEYISDNVSDINMENSKKIFWAKHKSHY